MVNRIILGGGLAGLTLAKFLGENVKEKDKEKITILEKEKVLGGLCRSFDMNGVYYDVGPHILFSKDKEILDFLVNITSTNKLKRSNKILYKGKFVHYPFENDLSSLPKEDIDYCLKEFMNNPYENYDPKNMLQFFLKTFGEGITNLYLRPYNEKIWKFDPSYMDTQMVERIPKPPKEDVIASAKGERKEGYVHQLYFDYPDKYGMQQIIDQLEKDIVNEGNVIEKGIDIQKIEKKGNVWSVVSSSGVFEAEKLVSCIPIHELVKLVGVSKEIKIAVDNLKYNSIIIVVMQFEEDNLGDNFAFLVPDTDVIFHRLSKVNFFGEKYRKDKNGKDISTLMMEITYREGSYIDSLSDEEIFKRVKEGIDKLKIAESSKFVDSELKKFKYAYVIYDVDHQENVKIVRDYFEKEGIILNGRFAEFEYNNMDKIARNSLELSKELSKKDLN